MRSGLSCSIVVAFLLVQSSLPALARTKLRPVTPDRDYASALGIADRFLHAWQMQDPESGLLLLTDRVRQHTDESQLRDFFSSRRSLSPGFEIGRGKKLSGTRYKFPVALFPADSTHERRAKHPFTLIVVRIGRDDWAIDKLP
jgi:hypothetical protein